MGNRTMLVGLMTAALLLAGILTVTSAASAAKGRTLRLFEHDTQQAALDLGDKGNSPGDQFVYAGDVFDHAGGSKLGRAGGYCSTLSGDANNPGEVYCTVNVLLAGGQISGEGMFDAAALFTRGETLSFPVTGGTGTYRNARGYGTVQIPPDVPNETDANFVLHLN